MLEAIAEQKFAVEYFHRSTLTNVSKARADEHRALHRLGFVRIVLLKDAGTSVVGCLSYPRACPG